MRKITISNQTEIKKKIAIGYIDELEPRVTLKLLPHQDVEQELDTMNFMTIHDDLKPKHNKNLIP